MGWSGDDLLVPKQVIVHWNQGGNGPDVLQGFLQPVGRRGFSSRISISLTGLLATVSCSPRVTQMSRPSTSPSGGSQPGGQRGQTDCAGHPQELALHGHEAYLVQHRCQDLQELNA